MIFCNTSGQYEKLANMIILIFKQYICASKCLKTTPTFITVLSKVVDWQHIEYRVTLLQKKISKHKSKWVSFFECIIIYCQNNIKSNETKYIIPWSYPLRTAPIPLNFFVLLYIQKLNKTYVKLKKIF